MAKGFIAFVVGIVIVIGGAIFWLACVPSYNKPEFVVVENNQTAFMIPLEGDTKDQTHFFSVDYLKEKKVAAKRIQVPRRWIQLGRLPASGEYMDMVRVIKVDRSPVIREWVHQGGKGTSPGDESLEATSKDGVMFTIGFTCTALIPDDEHAAEFLFWYKGDSLSHVMDSEFRARVQGVVTHAAVEFTMDALRGQQNAIMKSIESDLKPFFENRGIMITAMGFVGGFRYVNPNVQDAIDKTVQDQQLKVSAEARRMAQETENKTVKLAAEGKADAARAQAKGEADAIKMVADAKAYEIEAAKDKPFYLSLKHLELESQRLKSWDGKLPQSYFTGGVSGPMPTLLMPVPLPVTDNKK